MSYGTPYEATPIKPARVGRAIKMPNNTKTEAVKASPKRYAKTRGEHYKDMVIVALIVGIVAFGLGVRFQANRNAELQSAVKAAQTAAVTPAPEVKK